MENNHPWVVAAGHMGPQPVMAMVTVDEVELRQSEDADAMDAVLLTIIDATGIKNTFISPDLFRGIIQQGISIINDWDTKKSGLVIADKGMEQKAKNMHKRSNHLRGL